MNKIQQAKEDVIEAAREAERAMREAPTHSIVYNRALAELAVAVRELHKAEEPDPWKLLEAYWDENLLEHMTSTARQEIVDAIRWGRENGKL